MVVLWGHTGFLRQIPRPVRIRVKYELLNKFVTSEWVSLIQSQIAQDSLCWQLKSHLFKQFKSLLSYHEGGKKKKTKPNPKEWLLQLSFIQLYWMGPQRLVEIWEALTAPAAGDAVFCPLVFTLSNAWWTPHSSLETALSLHSWPPHTSHRHFSWWRKWWHLPEMRAHLPCPWCSHRLPPLGKNRTWLLGEVGEEEENAITLPHPGTASPVSVQSDLLRETVSSTPFVQAHAWMHMSQDSFNSSVLTISRPTRGSVQLYDKLSVWNDTTRWLWIPVAMNTQNYSYMC